MDPGPKALAMPNSVDKQKAKVEHTNSDSRALLEMMFSGTYVSFFMPWRDQVLQ